MRAHTIDGYTDQWLLHICDGSSIDRGVYGHVLLFSLGLIIVGFAPTEMGKGNWSVGPIVDEGAQPRTTE
jgi:hypothetical protein